MLSILISIVASVVGVFGNTFNSKKKGLKRITPIGWIVVIVGLSTGVINSLKYVKDQEEITIQQNNRENLARLANSEIQEAVNNILFPWRILYLDICEKFNQECEAKWYGESKNITYKDLTSAKFLARFDSINFITDFPTKFVSKILWYQFIGEQTKASKIKLDEIWLKYGVYLDLQTVVDIQEVVTDPFFTSASALVTRQGPKDDLEGLRIFVMVQISSPEGKKRFISFLQKVDKLNAHASSK